ncbi:acetyl-CoA carboxylase biotin carboxyl carrier protein [bacterium]|nr:acetyl-CoA carboxylase biotin carboxyl carrier protein [bacterium]
MKEEEIRRLVKIVEESSIGELEISRWGKTIKISKYPQNSHPHTNSTPPITTPHASVPIELPPAENPAAPAPSVELETQAKAAKTIEIKAPMVGTFYRSPSPDADPYVDVNQQIKTGQVLCIIEAMKLMNEIESENSGRIVEILVENGQPVEYNQPLFLIEPS